MVLLVSLVRKVPKDPPVLKVLQGKMVFLGLKVQMVLLVNLVLKALLDLKVVQVLKVVQEIRVIKANKAKWVLLAPAFNALSLSELMLPKVRSQLPRVLLLTLLLEVVSTAVVVTGSYSPAPS